MKEELNHFHAIFVRRNLHTRALYTSISVELMVLITLTSVTVLHIVTHNSKSEVSAV